MCDCILDPEVFLFFFPSHSMKDFRMGRERQHEKKSEEMKIESAVVTLYESEGLPREHLTRAPLCLFKLAKLHSRAAV